MISWDVDDRPATLRARAYMLGMRIARDKQAFEGEEHTLQVARQRQQSGNCPPTRLTRWVSGIRETRRDGMTVWTVRPRRTRPVARVFYVHGGGYVHPLTADYWLLVRDLARAGIEVVVPAYPLAPDATVDTVLPALQRLAEESLAGLPTVLMGDSAGGALVLVLAQLLRDAGGAQPAGVVMLSPWLDATLDEDAVAGLEASDPMLAESGLRAAGRWWAGSRSPADPLVSPVNGDVHDLPPLDVFIGDKDILRPAVDDLVAKARVQDADLRLHEVRAMFHVWMTRRIPEARRTRQALVRIVRERVGAGAVPGATWHFEQQVTVNAPAAEVWARVVTPEGINDEMRPVMTMTLPRGAQSVTIDTITVGQPIGRAPLRLGGLIPFEYDDLLVAELEPGRRFREESTMLSMRAWIHDRTVEPAGNRTVVTDRVTFEPRLPLSVAGPVLSGVIQAFFAHRHRRLRRYFG
ncbi:steryl acetyl hydrolase [Aeromicrobium phragmitis]|uniref:Steryl acetyl hydrolase n=1 Tax=Aeromicrobium phragmitis TaxID=2478914 RepID=A0A3L8PPW3_9ACTN|nr:alpha/beta hydrolase fold domain-containing protein [Aeromicrobium phragmitis]RLV56753.1 steryl acetyl hydrolase [Aeromicrobium phragmitis]